ncbi:hypothetical protein M422DRAFT_49041 [Sphaerobolus stellatus SS14]|uniref:Uncharacterized protein n=1 Tax=Sphaerobolus stellatus (strain SS14) TaxID=990650 RepID=A0A0C9UC16_SPHS4|nr:hypothetical protein M422DRAFT_49041 [Sphaerobolus stellatus SS14]
MNGETTTENDGPSHSMSMNSISCNESVDSIHTMAHILSNFLPLEPNGSLKEEFAGQSDETLQGSDELEDLLDISWTSLKEEDYLVALLAQELIRSCKELCKYMAAICNNVKILANKAYILEEELFHKLLNMVLPMVIEALLKSHEHKHFDLMAA